MKFFSLWETPPALAINSSLKKYQEHSTIENATGQPDITTVSASNATSTNKCISSHTPNHIHQHTFQTQLPKHQQSSPPEHPLQYCSNKGKAAWTCNAAPKAYSNNETTGIATTQNHPLKPIPFS